MKIFNKFEWGNQRRRRAGIMALSAITGPHFIQENKGSPVFKSRYQQTISVDIAILLAGFSCLRLEVIRQVINCHYRHIMQFSELNNL
ncbi:hypothetical protein AIZ04_25450, partial [Salmonella enterica subsp. enterica serovar Typhimurium]